nr:small nuclear ribonucleoprotein E-like [Ipomoea batatas]
MQKARIQIWLFEQKDLRIEGRIIGFDEYMNLVLDDAEEVNVKKNSRKQLGRILLKGDNITLMMNTYVIAGEVTSWMAIWISAAYYRSLGNPLNFNYYNQWYSGDELTYTRSSLIRRPFCLAVKSAFTSGSISLGNVASHGGEQSDAMLGGGDGVSGGSVHHETAELSGGLQIHIVNPDAGPPDHLEAALGRLKHLARDLRPAPHDQRVKLRDLVA